MLTLNNDKRFTKQAMYVLFFLLLTRLFSMLFIPLNDSTEARYGEIARKMLETGNWVTPLHDYGIPFWAKPPLSTWLSAFSMQLFGVNALAARLPSLLLSLGILGLIYFLAQSQRGRVSAMVSVVLLAGTLFFYLDAGTVMTDPAFLFSVTLTLTAFWRGLHPLQAALRANYWSYLFFVGLGLGLLAKGPLILVLTGLPIFFWVLYQNAWARLWRCFPWIKGTLITCLIALPWYWLAELRTPGFLNYFLIGEHLSRFLEPGWTGDKYGFAHHQPLGMIWVYAIIGIIPWGIPCLLAFKNRKKNKQTLSDAADGWLLFLFLWLFTPLLFFTFASNIIYPYVLPGLPAAALLLSELSQRGYYEKVWVVYLAPVCGFIFLIMTLLFLFKPSLVEKSQKRVIQAWIQANPAREGNLVYWGLKLEASAQFYSDGQVKLAHDLNRLTAIFSKSKKNYLVVDEDLISSVPKSIFQKLKRIDTLALGAKKISLFWYCPS